MPGIANMLFDDFSIVRCHQSFLMLKHAAQQKKDMPPAVHTMTLSFSIRRTIRPDLPDTARTILSDLTVQLEAYSIVTLQTYPTVHLTTRWWSILAICSDFTCADFLKLAKRIGSPSLLQ